MLVIRPLHTPTLSRLQRVITSRAAAKKQRIVLRTCIPSMYM